MRGNRFERSPQRLFARDAGQQQLQLLQPVKGDLAWIARASAEFKPAGLLREPGRCFLDDRLFRLDAFDEVFQNATILFDFSS